MLSTRLVRLLSAQYKNRSISAITQRFYSSSTDYVPGPYPKTKEERIAAARKYNLQPEDYETYPEEQGFGDYPKLKGVHAGDRDTHYDYDNNYVRFNYGEPLPNNFLDMFPDRVRMNTDQLPSPSKMIFQFTGSLFLIFVVAYISLEYGRIIHDRKPKQYPAEYFDFGPKPTHYTFEPAE